MKVLLAIDSVATMQLLADHVISRPWPPDTLFGILTVVDSKNQKIPVSGAAKDENRTIQEKLDEAHMLVKLTQEKLSAGGLEVTTAVVEGSPRLKIIEYAGLWNVDFVIVAALGHTSYTQFFLGSVAKSVVREAPCSVEVVRQLNVVEDQPEKEKGLRILVATDGSMYARTACYSVLNRPWPPGSQIRVISVAELPASMATQWNEPSELVEKVDPDTKQKAQKAVDEAQKIFSGSGCELSGAVLIGNAKEVIPEEAERWNADLVVLGTHGHHGIQRILTRSVSDSVAIHAPCSVEVIRQSII